MEIIKKIKVKKGSYNMAIMRKNKQREFTMIDNYLINDINLKPESKGYLVFMLNKPDNWQFNFTYLSKALGVGEKTISTNLKKLEKLKYLKREKVHDDKGHYVWIYNVFEKPYDLYLEQEIEQSPQQRGMDEGGTDIGGIYKDGNKQNCIDKIDKTSNGISHSIFTIELIKMKYISLKELNLELAKKINDLKDDDRYDDYRIISERAEWKDVLTVYVAKITNGDMKQEVMTLNKRKIQVLKEIFWDMNEIETEEKNEYVYDDSKHPKKVYKTTLYIKIKGKSINEMMNEYGFNSEQRKEVKELQKEEYDSMWMSAVYGTSVGSPNMVVIALS